MSLTCSTICLVLTCSFVKPLRKELDCYNPLWAHADVWITTQETRANVGIAISHARRRPRTIIITRPQCQTKMRCHCNMRTKPIGLNGHRPGKKTNSARDRHVTPEAARQTPDNERTNITQHENNAIINCNNKKHNRRRCRPTNGWA